ncbi:HAD family hydrolase [Geminisphaera colitermitum]|uniref:HAD family hydrolase n=1 Tax=Geminisphaera colitermitum TaxID=1148786 RepID=UPI0001965321|nr:HAD family phosphatase [Geminisphaera colitermitum]
MKIELPDHDYAAYIFDCDGTLADTMPAHHRSWARVAAEAGNALSRELFHTWGGRSCREIVDTINQLWNLNLDANETMERRDRYFCELLDEGGISPIAPVVAIARNLHERGRPIAVASGGRHSIVRPTLAAVGVDDLFDVVVCAGDYERGKPHPDAFLVAATRLGIAPGECLVFEDSAAGIQAARAAGMACVVIPDNVSQ